jgi:hypothetical protein
MRIKTSLLASLVLLSTSCGFHQGIRRDSDTEHDFQYRMEVADVQVSRTASGSSEIGSLFCLIPLGNDPYKTAMENLHKNANLQKNEVLANYRDDMGITGLVYLWCNFRLTVSADVLTLTPKGGSTTPPAPVTP